MSVDAIRARLQQFPAERPQQQEEAREEIVKIIEKVFDFEEVTRRAVGRHWSRFSEPQKKELIERFKQLLRQTISIRRSSLWGGALSSA